MSTSLEITRIRERNEAGTKPHDRFIDRHRLVLLRYLDGTAPGSAEQPDALGFIEKVLTTWQELFGETELAVPSPEERTFWFTLYLLEELLEPSDRQICPYEEILMKNLVEVRELLRHRQPLPEHLFMATRPDGT
jgi:hypothetical protein